MLLAGLEPKSDRDGGLEEGPIPTSTVGFGVGLTVGCAVGFTSSPAWNSVRGAARAAEPRATALPPPPAALDLGERAGRPLERWFGSEVRHIG